jgi:hypothetical protein
LLALCPRTNAPAPGASRSVVGVHHVLRWFLASQGGGGPAMYQRGRIRVPPNRGEQTKIQQGGFGLLEAARDAEWRLGHLGQIMAELGQFGRGELERFSCRGASAAGGVRDPGAGDGCSMSFGQPCLSCAAEGDTDVIDCYHTAKRAQSKKSPGNPGRSTGLRKGRLSHATASHGPMLTELGRVLQRGSRLGEWA